MKEWDIYSYTVILNRFMIYSITTSKYQYNNTDTKNVVHLEHAEHCFLKKQ